MDHLACMTTFVTVVEKGGFAAAARHLSIVPGTVTLQVQTLERRLGARLLQRTTRRSSLTEAGQAFYERAVKILTDIREADDIANVFHATSRGTIRLQISPTLSKDVSALVARYSADHPETSFDLLTANRLGDLIEERIDLAIRDDAIPDSSLIVRRLACAGWTACASPGHIAKHGSPAHPADLAGHNCLVYDRGRDSAEWRFRDADDCKSIRVSGSLCSSDPHAVRMAALCDQGLALLPDALIAEDLQMRRLVGVLDGYTAEQAVVRAIFPSRQQLSLKVRTFLDFAARVFDAHAPAERRPAGAHSNAMTGTRHSAERGGDGHRARSPAGSQSMIANCSGTRHWPAAAA